MDDAWLGRLFVRFRDRGDGKALAAVFDATARELLGVAAHLAPGLDRAEDLVQTTFLRAIERSRSFDGSRSLKAWLYGILWREAAKLKRSERRSPAPESLPEARDQTLDAAVEHELSETLDRALLHVPSPYREVLEAVLREERSTADVASALARSPGTVRVQLQRGLERLRRELGAARRAGNLRALALGDIAAMRVRVLARAGVAKTAVPAATGVFLALQWASATLTPPLLGATALAITLTGGAGWVATHRWARGHVADRQLVEEHAAPVSTASAERAMAPAAVALGEEDSPQREPLREATVAPPRPPRTLPAEDVQVAGIVIDAGRRPLEGVEVIAEGESHYGYRSTTTDARGRFAFGGLAEGRWYFYADDERYARMWWQAHGVGVEEDDDAEFEAELELVLYPPHGVRGQVVDEAGAPVPGTKVTLAVEWLEGAEAPLQGHLTQEIAVAETDADGRFALERLLPGRMTVVLDHDGFARTLADFVVPGAPPRLVIEGGSTLAGQVVRAGAPLAGVRVRAHSTRQSHLTMGDWDVRSDADGRFRIEHVHPVGESRQHGVSTLKVAVDDEEWTSGAQDVFEDERGLLPPVVLEAIGRGEAQPERVDVGRDLAAEARLRGEPFGSGAIRVKLAEPSDDEISVWIRLGADFAKSAAVPPGGAALFENLAAGSYGVTPVNTRTTTLAAQRLELAVGETREVELRPGTATLAGTLRCGGEPARAEEAFCRRIRESGGFQAIGTLEADGRYRFAGLVPGSYELLVSARDAFTRSVEVRVESADTWCDVELPPGRIEGRISGVEFEPDRNDFDRRRVRVFPYGWYQESGNRGAFVEPDAEGRFAVRHLPPGDYVVSVTRAKERVESRVVTITAGAPVQRVELGAVRTLGIAAGRILGEHGDRLSIAFLRREPQGLRRVEYAEVDPSGEFRQELESGRYALLVSDFQARAPFTWIPEFAVAAGATNTLELALPPSRTVTVRLDARDAWIPRAIWRLRMPTGEWLPYVFFVGSDAEGRRAPTRPFRLPVGAYALEADFGDPLPIVHEFAVAAGDGTLEVQIARPR